MRFNVEVKTELDDRKVIGGLIKTLAQAMHMMEGEAVRLCPVDTGRLRGSIHIDRIDDFHWIMADGVDYGVCVEYGTSPHIIIPKHKQALRFKIDEKETFAKRVRHPGTNAQPFFRPALSFTKQVVPELIEFNLRAV